VDGTDPIVGIITDEQMAISGNCNSCWMIEEAVCPSTILESIDIPPMAMGHSVAFTEFRVQSSETAQKSTHDIGEIRRTLQQW